MAFALFYSIMNVAALTQVGFGLGIGLFGTTQPQVVTRSVKLFYAIMLVTALAQVGCLPAERTPSAHLPASLRHPAVFMMPSC